MALVRRARSSRAALSVEALEDRCLPSGAATHFAVFGPPQPVTSDGFLSISIIALDASNEVATGYTGPAQLHTTDPKTTLPSVVAVDPYNPGRLFAYGLLPTPGLQTVTVTDQADPTVSGSATVQVVPCPIIATGPGPGSPPLVQVYDSADGTPEFSFLAYDAGFTGGVRVAVANMDHGQQAPLIVTAPGPGMAPLVRVFDGQTGAMLHQFLAYDADFTGGVSVAVGDVNADGSTDVITGPGPGARPRVKVFNQDGSLQTSFLAYDAHFLGGVNVAAGDVNADGRADVVTGAGPGGGPHVQVFSGLDGSLLWSFMAYDPHFLGGVSVAAGDVNADGHADIVTGAGAGGGPQVNVFNGATGAPVVSFMAYDPHFTGGVQVTVNDVGNVVTAPGGGGGPHVEEFNTPYLAYLATQYTFDPRWALMDSFYAYDPAFAGGVSVGGGYARFSCRPIFFPLAVAP